MRYLKTIFRSFYKKITFAARQGYKRDAKRPIHYIILSASRYRLKDLFTKNYSITTLSFCKAHFIFLINFLRNCIYYLLVRMGIFGRVLHFWCEKLSNCTTDLPKIAKNRRFFQGYNFVTICPARAFCVNFTKQKRFFGLTIITIVDIISLHCVFFKGASVSTLRAGCFSIYLLYIKGKFNDRKVKSRAD